MKNMIMSVFIVILCTLFSGCAVFMAAHQPEYKNLGVASAGVSRPEVVAEFGMPIASEVDPQGDKVEVFKFKQGYGKGNKASRAIFHGVADVFTFGLWEVVATPAEAVFSGHEVAIKVTYDKQDIVKNVVYLKGKE